MVDISRSFERICEREGALHGSLWVGKGTELIRNKMWKYFDISCKKTIIKTDLSVSFELKGTEVFFLEKLYYKVKV